MLSKDICSDFNVLIAMQNMQLAKYIYTYMRDVGAASLKVADNSRKATSLLRSDQFNLIFCDCDLDPLGGIDFVKYLRISNSPSDEAMVMYIMPEPSKGKVISARNAGVHEIIAPPITGKLIEQRITYMITHPKPFIRVPTYTGPCRRRDRAKVYRGVERRQDKVMHSL